MVCSAAIRSIVLHEIREDPVSVTEIHLSRVRYCGAEFSLVIGLSFDDAKASVDLLQQDDLHQLVREGQL